MEGRMKIKTTALVLETNNLAGGRAGAEQIATTLTRLLRHLRSQTRPLASLNELIVTHEGLRPEHRRALEEDAGREIQFVELPKSTGYYEAKNLGFEATSSDLIVFGDSDCWPASDWLDRLLTPLEQDESARLGAVAGRTTYRDDLGGIAATTIDFAYFKSPLDDRCTRNFYANNVVFRREVFERYRYHRMEHIYRGHCQVLGLRLHAGGVHIHFEPRAHTTHRFPDSSREFVRLRLLRGQDGVFALPHFTAALLPGFLRGLGRFSPVALPTLALRCLHSVATINRQDMVPVHGLRRLACVGLVAGIYFLDAIGAVKAMVGRPSTGQVPVLSYHEDVDSLSNHSAT